VDIAGRFMQALRAEAGPPAGDQVPIAVRLTRAAAAALPVDAASLTVDAGLDLRAPVAASSETAATAERLQFTAVEGPCLHVTETGTPVVAPEEDLARWWPVFHDLLVSNTPLRSVVALPLPAPLEGLGVLEMFSTEPAGAARMDSSEAQIVARLIARRLDRDADWSTRSALDGPAWVNTPGARRRSRLWIGVGMVIAELHLPAPDALAVLRSHAYATGRSVDDLADDLVVGRADPAELREAAGLDG
jgi:hypothetical protein